MTQETRRLIDWTGERCVPWADDVQVVYEHFHRYYVAAGLVAGRRVLDLGTGEGYGAAVLAERAAEVLAIDVDAPSIEHARATYDSDNLTFEVGSILELDDFPDASWDAVVCFEVIEHVDDHERVLDSVGRLLTDDGILVLSTPDRKLYAGDDGAENPFHVRELSREELRSLLRGRFEHVDLFDLQTVTGSWLRREGAGEDGRSLAVAIERDGEGWRRDGSFPAPYLLAVASRSPLGDLPDQSFLADPGLELMRRQERRADALEERLRGSRTAELEELVARRTRERDEARRAISRAAAAGAESVREQYVDLSAYVVEEHATRGWRALNTYRRTVGAIRSGRPVRVRAVLRTAAERTAKATPPARGREQARFVGTAGRDIVFRPSERPRVSIVVPAFNNVGVTLACLRSLARNTPHELIEVIVVDDVSTDATPEALAQTTGVTVVRNRHNVGFLQTCNRGAAEAAGEFVLFLNNDVEVEPEWLETLLDAADSSPDVGAVGSKLVYPDGTLQEAGAFIWSNGEAWNFGRDGDPEAPEFNYRREVDYCSGAALLVRRELFESVGGFDVRYAPIYYEETDLCFALRAEGYRVLYEPRSVVVHHEGLTHGTERKAGVGGSAHSKESQFRNRHVFLDKWRDVLARHRPPPTAEAYLGGRIDRRPRLLVADTWVPAHDRDSGSLRMTSILRLLRSLGCTVTLFTTDRERREPYSTELQRLGVEVHYGPETFAELAEARTGFYDVVLLSRPYVALPLLDDVGRWFPLATIVYDMIDAHFLREGRKAELLGSARALDASALKRDELACVRRSDITIAVTEDEAELVRSEVPDAVVRVLPNVHELDEGPSPPFDERAGLLFIGGFRHDPNVDAVRHLVNDVMPLVRAELGDVPLTIAGSHPPPEVAALRSPSVAVTGYVPDVSGLFRQSRVFVAPLRYGAGMKGKVGHAMAFGLPLVTTRIGAEGMGLADGKHALIRDGADAFADAVVRLYRDRELWGRLAAESRDRVAAEWSPEAMERRLLALLEEAVGLPFRSIAPVASAPRR